MMSLSLLSLLACQPDEESGIDRTDIFGHVTIVPQNVDEQAEGPEDSEEADNDALEAAQSIGSLSYRRVIFSGTCDEYRTAGPGGPASGDIDHVQFEAPFTGSITLELWHESSVSPEQGLETGGEDPQSYDLVVYDMDNLSGGTPPDEESTYSVILDTVTDGGYGQFSTAVNVNAGGNYVVKVAGRQNRASDPNTYALKLSGYDPNGVIASPGQELPAGWQELNGEIYVQAPKTFLVGAYLNSDFAAKGNPVGGTNVVDFSLECYCPGTSDIPCQISESCATPSGLQCVPPDRNADGLIDTCVELNEPEDFDRETEYRSYGLTDAWTGAFQIRDVKKVTTCVDGDEECEAGTESGRSLSSDTGDTSDSGETADSGDEASDTGTEDTASEPATEPVTEPSSEPAAEEEEPPPTTTYVDESLSTVHLMSGSFPSLNSGLVAGMLFSSQPVPVNVENAKHSYSATSYRHEIRDVSIVIDTVQPKVYGWTHEEVEPNNAADYGDYYTLGDSSGAGTPDIASGPGIVDVITGTIEFAEEAPGDWSAEHDLFALTVPETSGAFVTMDWGDAGYDLDLHLYNGAGEVVAYSWYAKPEVFDSIGEFEVTFEPGETYYIGVLGWDVAATGNTDYTIEIEWLAP